MDFPALSTTLQDGGYSGPLLLEKVPGRKYRLRGIMCRVCHPNPLSISGEYPLVVMWSVLVEQSLSMSHHKADDVSYDTSESPFLHIHDSPAGVFIGTVEAIDEGFSKGRSLCRAMWMMPKETQQQQPKL